MKERPILFNGDMVRAILDGSKTMTRRVVKQQPEMNHQWQSFPTYLFTSDIHNTKDGCAVRFAHIHRESGVTSGESFWVTCPYGKPGDRLWVREEHYRYGHWEPIPGVKTKTGRQKWKFVQDTSELKYEAPESYRKGMHHKDPGTPAWHKRLARFIPRWASRITLDVISVRVERLQDISEEDAWAEGCEKGEPTNNGGWFPAGEPDPSGIGFRGWDCASDWYADLWDEINAERGFDWDSNPWVWVVEFKRAEGASK